MPKNDVSNESHITLNILIHMYSKGPTQECMSAQAEKNFLSADEL